MKINVIHHVQLAHLNPIVFIVHHVVQIVQTVPVLVNVTNVQPVMSYTNNIVFFDMILPFQFKKCMTNLFRK